MHYNRQWQYGMGVLAFVWGLGLSLPQAQAFPIGCGAILGPGGTFVLDSDVGPCGGPDPALTLISATLDLAGHTVSCSTTSIYGIAVEGKNSGVRNGMVSGCGHGVVLFGQGSHEVRDVTASGNVTGFAAGSSRNKLTNNTATGNEFVGFAVGGAQNQLTGSTASGSEFGFLFVGFLFEKATNSLLSSNTATDNFVGFEIFGSSGNLLTSNTASDNRSNGFEGDLNANNRWAANTASGNAAGFFFAGDTNDAWIGNTASDNGGLGFGFEDGGGNSLNDNRASGNGFLGFGIAESNDRLGGNKATSNIGPGIHLETGATDNRIHNSKALGNGSFDLEDDNLGCGANIWSSNTFGMANQGCIH